MAKILIIDDDPQIVTMLSKFLDLEGHAVVTASNGKEGLTILAESAFEVVITDMMMPERDGLDVLKTIRNMQNKPKIIAMSGGSPYIDQEHLLRMAKLMKADVVIPKPLQLSKLSQKIQEILSTP